MATARHPKAFVFVQRHLFAGLTGFAELEKRISNLADEKSRGDAFEVFAEAYLATQRKHDAKIIWPFASIPPDLLESLKLGTQDYGIDGVLALRLGHHGVYQVKFRTGRPALTWRELSTFMGLADSPNIHSRILFTNCDELSSVLNDRRGFFCIRGSDLDRLTADDFKVIEAWLAGSAYQASRKTPQSHQIEALQKIVPAFKECDRVSAIMACGTGKTLVTLWVAEKMRTRRILVLLPSLALLRQTLYEWTRETSFRSLAYLCVCSDASVKEGMDAPITAQSDLDFEVSTDSNSVRAFLDASFAGTKIIFCTYQSARVVGKAMKADEVFDLGIFDEAHKTAGGIGRNFSFALEDHNLPIRKRLFVTATPRHYNPLNKNREGDAQLVFSMDRPEIYGSQAYRLPFSEAAKRGIICRYKVVITVITSQQVTNELLSSGEVVVNGDGIRARQVANQIALKDAIYEYGLNKVFTFHSTVASAASFIGQNNGGVATHLPHFKTLHVNGSMPTVSREHVMREFRTCKKGIISNARCLTEGVDVPAVDMVAFLSPKRSRVDIVQAIGRAMRRSPGKTTGYVLLPLYVELASGETVETAINRAEFDEVWDVLQSLQEQDDVFAEIIRAMNEERGRTHGFDDSRFRGLVEILGPEISLDSLRKAICTSCLETLGDSWEVRFGELKAYKEKYGHCNVSAHRAEHQKLGVWVHYQRRLLKKRLLLSYREDKLVNLGFDFNPSAQSATIWLARFNELVDFKKRHGHCNVPDQWGENKQLSIWVARQRQRWKKELLLPQRKEQLKALGFVFNPAEQEEEIWRDRFNELVAYRKRHGHCNVPVRWAENPELANWMSRQRQLRKKKLLLLDREKKLRETGFVFDPFEEVWQIGFKELVAYKNHHGHCNVPDEWGGNPQLAKWVGHQRRAQKTGKLNRERFRLLEELGFIWDTLESRWQLRFEELQAFKSENDHCNVPARWRENRLLSTWAQHQRKNWKAGQLSKERLDKLHSIGFVFDPFEEKWNEMFEYLWRFHSAHGHCIVPHDWAANKDLARWVFQQRRDARTGRLPHARVMKLKSLQFSWDAFGDNWSRMYSDLQKFRIEHGHSVVPKNWQRNPQLSIWVQRQRQARKKGRMSANRIAALDKAGFVWDSFDAAWRQFFAQLEMFRKRFKHCNVPARWPGNRPLARWVVTQRMYKRNGKLAKNRICQLNSIAFHWAVK